MRCFVRSCCEAFTSTVISCSFLRHILNKGLVVVGFSGGSIERIPANHLLVKNVSAIGVYLGGYLKNRPRVVEEVLVVSWMGCSV